MGSRNLRKGRPLSRRSGPPSAGFVQYFDLISGSGSQKGVKK